MDNNLLDLIKADPYFESIKLRLETGGDLLDHGSFVGRAVEQVDEFLQEEVQPVMDKYAQQLSQSQDATLSV